MHNDSLENLLLRHYGNTAPTPHALEQHLIAAVHRETAQQQHRQKVVQHVHTYRISRRRAIQLVAISSTGLGLLSVGMESLHSIEMALLGQDIAPQRQAFP
jgi:hypothetical protein